MLSCKVVIEMCGKSEFGFLFEPSYEAEVQVFFGVLMPHVGKFFNDLGLGSEFYVDEFSGSFPDCTLRIDGKDVRVEFELFSSHFRDHGHDPEKCDLIVCWKHDWYSCPGKMKILELSAVVSDLRKQNGLPDFIRLGRPKHGDRQGRRWSIKEFMDTLRKNLPAGDFLQIESFVEELNILKGKGVEIQTGRGRKIPTINIGFGKSTNLGYPLGIQVDGKAWIAYKNVNVKPPRPIIDEKKAGELRRLLGGASDNWHDIKASNKKELVDKLRKAVIIMTAESGR